MSAFLSFRRSSAFVAGVAHLASKNVLRRLFSGTSNFPLCADAYVWRKCGPNCRKSSKMYMVESADTPDQFLLKIGNAPVTLASIWRWFCELPPARARAAACER